MTLEVSSNVLIREGIYNHFGKLIKTVNKCHYSEISLPKSYHDYDIFYHNRDTCIYIKPSNTLSVIFNYNTIFRKCKDRIIFVSFIGNIFIFDNSGIRHVAKIDNLTIAMGHFISDNQIMMKAYNNIFVLELNIEKLFYKKISYNFESLIKFKESPKYIYATDNFSYYHIKDSENNFCKISDGVKKIIVKNVLCIKYYPEDNIFIVADNINIYTYYGNTGILLQFKLNLMKKSLFKLFNKDITRTHYTDALIYGENLLITNNNEVSFYYNNKYIRSVPGEYFNVSVIKPSEKDIIKYNKNVEEVISKNLNYIINDLKNIIKEYLLYKL